MAGGNASAATRGDPGARKFARSVPSSRHRKTSSKSIFLLADEENRLIAGAVRAAVFGAAQWRGVAASSAGR
jgi:hypothetical protein